MEIVVARYIPKKMSLFYPSFEDFKKDLHALYTCTVHKPSEQARTVPYKYKYLTLNSVVGGGHSRTIWLAENSYTTVSSNSVRVSTFELRVVVVEKHNCLVRLSKRHKFSISQLSKGDVYSMCKNKYQ